MKPPRCRLCGHCHWNSEPHVFPDEPAREAVNDASASNGAVTHAESVVNKIEAAGAVSRQVKWQQENRGRYNAKMKEAMRRYREKRRAAARAGLEA